MFFKIQYSLHGKEFEVWVKEDDDQRYWTSIYINKFNPKNDIYIRRESASPDYKKYSQPLTKNDFVAMLNQAIATVTYN